jgi:hypothetical protein
MIFEYVSIFNSLPIFGGVRAKKAEVYGQNSRIERIAQQMPLFDADPQPLRLFSLWTFTPAWGIFAAASNAQCPTGRNA